MKTKKTLAKLLTIALILSIIAAVPIPTTTAWVDGKQRAEWPKVARNYRDNILHWWFTAWRGVPFLTYMLWDYVSERADEYAYNASRPVSVDDIRQALYDIYVPMYMTDSEFWGNLTAFEAAFGWQPLGYQSEPPTHTYVHVNWTVFFTSANLTGTRFNVSIWVQNVTDMWAAGIKLGYNASMINATHVYPGAIPQTYGVEKWLPTDALGVYHPDAPPTINHTRRYTPNFSPLDSTTYGYVWTDFFLQKPNYFTGTGELLIIEFEIIYAPNRTIVPLPGENRSVYTYLDLFSMFDTTVDGSMIELLDSGANPIEHAALDGRYTYIREQQVAGAPTAVCSVSPSTVYVGDSVTFDGTASDDGGAPPLTYAWDVDSDGTIEFTTATATYTPPAAGSYNVTLTVTNALNLSHSTTCYFRVLEVVGPIIDLYTSPGRWSNVDTYDNMTGKGVDMPTDALTPGVEVTLYANVTYNGAPEMWALVTFEVIWEWQVDWYDPLQPWTLINETIMVATNYTDLNGITYVKFRVPTTGPPGDPNEYIGKWMVIAKTKVKEITVQDTMRFDVGYLIMLTEITVEGFNWITFDETLYRGSSIVRAHVSVKTLHWIPRPAVFTITVYSDSNELIGALYTETTVPGIARYCSPYHFTHTTLWVYIPIWANVGIGRVEVTVLTALPRDSGVAYSPSISSDIEITWWS
jgi:PKD repeat protein